MKRILCMALFLLLLVSAVGCKKSSAPVKTETVEGTLEEILQKVYDNSGAELPKLGNTAITRENMSYYLGTDSFAFTEGLASEAMISAIPFSVCLVRVPKDADVAKIKTAIQENVNPNKWICVGVDDSNVIVDSIGDLVILIMADASADIHEGFLALASK